MKAKESKRNEKGHKATREKKKEKGRKTNIPKLISLLKVEQLQATQNSITPEPNHTLEKVLISFW